VRKTIDLAAAVQAVSQQPGQALTLGELVRAYGLSHLDGSDCRLRKWVHSFGTLSAWDVDPEQLEAAAQAMLEHGYSPGSVNRDLGALGSVYRWAKSKRLSPRGFRSPTLSVRRFDEPIRRVHLEAGQLEALRARARAFRDRRFGLFVSLLIDTGARKSELLERRWSDVDLDRREILVPVTKNGTPRVLFFSTDTAELILRLFPKRSPEKLLFEGRVPGSRSRSGRPGTRRRSIWGCEA